MYEDKNEEKLSPAPVQRGVEDTVKCRILEPFCYLDMEGRNLENIEKEIQIKEGITAPVKKGDILGKAVFMLDGEVIGETDIIATENVEKAGFFDYLKKILIIRKS